MTNNGVNASRVALPIAAPDYQRRKAPLVAVWNRDGVKELHTASNAADLCRLNGYSRQPHVDAAVEDDEGRHDDLPGAVNHIDTPLVPPPGTAPGSNQRLNKLRAEIAERGGTVDPAHGHRRLVQQLAALQPSTTVNPTQEKNTP